MSHYHWHLKERGKGNAVQEIVTCITHSCVNETDRLY